MVKNTSWVIGLVVYTGHETKIVKNSTKSLVKFSKLEDLLNWLMVGLIVIMIGISLAFAFLGRHWAIMMLGRSDYLEFQSNEGLLTQEQSAQEILQDIIQLGRWMLVLPNFMPISLLITLDTVRYI